MGSSGKAISCCSYSCPPSSSRQPHATSSLLWHLWGHSAHRCVPAMPSHQAPGEVFNEFLTPRLTHPMANYLTTGLVCKNHKFQSCRKLDLKAILQRPFLFQNLVRSPKFNFHQRGLVVSVGAAQYIHTHTRLLRLIYARHRRQTRQPGNGYGSVVNATCELHQLR